MKTIIPKIKHLLLLPLIFISTSLFAQIDSGYVDIKGGKLFYRIWGEGEPLVFLNGGPGYSSEGYEPYAIELSKIRKVILFDQRGTGRSTLRNRDNIGIHKMVNDVEELRKHLNIESWDVFGHSFGGKYAMYYTAKHGDSINKLVLSASPSYKGSISKYTQKFKNIPYKDLKYLYELENFQELKKEMHQIAPSMESIRKAEMVAKAKYYVYKKENFVVAADWFANKSNYSLHVNRKVNFSVNSSKIRKKKLKQFDKPVLIIHGVSDFLNLTNPKTNHEIFPNSQLEFIHESGHMMAIDQKEEYYNVIFDFLLGETGGNG